MHLASLSPPEQSGGDTAHLTGPDVAGLGLVLSYLALLMLEGLSPETAAITGVTTSAAVLAVLALPGQVARALTMLGTIRRSMERLEHPGDQP